MGWVARCETSGKKRLVSELKLLSMHAILGGTEEGSELHSGLAESCTLK